MRPVNAKRSSRCQTEQRLQGQGRKLIRVPTVSRGLPDRVIIASLLLAGSAFGQVNPTYSLGDDITLEIDGTASELDEIAWLEDSSGARRKLLDCSPTRREDLHTIHITYYLGIKLEGCSANSLHDGIGEGWGSRNDPLVFLKEYPGVEDLARKVPMARDIYDHLEEAYKAAAALERADAQP